MAITGLVPVYGLVLGPKWLVGKFAAAKSTPESLPLPATSPAPVKPVQQPA